MSFLDLYQGDQQQAAAIQPNEGHDLPSGFSENFNAAWSDGQLFSQSIGRANARAAALHDYLDEIRQKTGNDLTKEFIPDVAGGGRTGVTNFDEANERVAKLKENFPDLDLDPLSEDEIDKRALAKAQAAHRAYETLQQGEKTWGGSFGSFFGSGASAFSDPVNILALAVAPETKGIGILSSAMKWGAVAGVSQAAIEATSDSFKEQVQPGYMESGQPIREIGGAIIGGAALGGGTKAIIPLLGKAWTRVKTGQWPTSIRDAGNVIESEAHVADSNPFPGAEGEVAHREALTKSIDDILASRPVDISHQITPEMEAHFDVWHGSPHDFDAFDTSKIGSGEGAQAYGHGLYFSESPDVAGVYKERLAVKKGGIAPQGETEIRHEDGMWNVYVDGEIQNGFGAKSDADKYVNKGSLYRVRITADKDKFLDLDKNLNEQTPEVQAALKQAMGIDYDGNFDQALSDRKWKEHQYADGKTAVRNGFIAFSDDRVSQRLSDAGIPGSKYLDQGSRSGEGTRNFVVFDDKNVEITHKNGKQVSSQIRQDVVGQASSLPPKQGELPLAAEPVAPKMAAEPGPQPVLQTPDQMREIMASPDHQEIIRGDIDHAIREGDVMVPGLDENGNHTMLSVKAATDEIDRYKQAAEKIQACARPIEEAAE